MNEDSTAQRDEAETSSDPASLDQIREILFGNQAREIDVRFKEINDQLAEELGGLRSLVNERVNSLAEKLDKEVRILHESTNESQAESQKKRAELDEKLNNTANDLRQQVGALSETLSAAERSIRQAAERSLNDVKLQLISQMDGVREELQRDLSQVSGATVTRRAFGEALRELSSKFDEE